MKRRNNIVAIVFLVVVFALGIVSVVFAVDAGPGPERPVPSQPLPVKPVHAKPLTAKPVPGRPIPAKPVVPTEPVPQWDDGCVRAYSVKLDRQYLATLPAVSPASQAGRIPVGSQIDGGVSRANHVINWRNDCQC